MQAVEIVSKKLSSGESCDGKGVECRYFDVGNGRGAKMYRSARLRDRCYFMQKYAHKHGVGPETFDRFEVSIDDKDWFGYVTENVKPMSKRCDKNWRIFQNWPAESYDCNDWWSGIDILNTYNVYAYLSSKFEEIGINSYDMHEHNIGLTASGERVCLDFGFFHPKLDMPFIDALEKHSEPDKYSHCEGKYDDAALLKFDERMLILLESAIQ